MIEVRRAAVGLDEEELLELARIVVDQDQEAALRFLKRSVYDKVVRAQQGKLKSHLDVSGDPTAAFKASQKKEETR